MSNFNSPVKPSSTAVRVDPVKKRSCIFCPISCSGTKLSEVRESRLTIVNLLVGGSRIKFSGEFLLDEKLSSQKTE